MKIEKLNDNQIRCTLNKHDLIDRELKLSELAYGSEKARGLFRDMMNQAFDEFGFEADDIPLVIEAIPISGDCIVLIVTKVEDPEELDTRFAKFSPALEDLLEELESESEEDDELLSSEDTPDEEAPMLESTQKTPADIMDMIRKITGGIAGDDARLKDHIVPISERAKKALRDATAASKKAVSARVFSFNSIDEAALLASVIKSVFEGRSSLYKKPSERKYYLVLCSESESFSKIINMASEFGRRERVSASAPAYFAEHYETLIREDAINILGNL